MALPIDLRLAAVAKKSGLPVVVWASGTISKDPILCAGSRIDPQIMTVKTMLQSERWNRFQIFFENRHY
jgi:hypothetical protein